MNSSSLCFSITHPAANSCPPTSPPIFETTSFKTTLTFLPLFQTLLEDTFILF